MKIGIDKVNFYVPHLYLDMNKLAKERNVEPEKFTIGLGQDKMAIPPITQDPVTMAANAAMSLLNEADKKKIDLVIFGTETGIDHSKAAAVYVHNLLGLNPRARSVEMKQACYATTAAIQMAKGHVSLNPNSKVLILGSDIARYGLKTSGESTQGAGAVALVISANPAILALEDESGYITSDIMDFWRPIYSEYAYVDGRFSNEQYIAFFNSAWKEFKEKSNLTLADFEAICFHLPYTRMGIKALETILDETTEKDKERLLSNYKYSTLYNRDVGNIYTGSLYLSLISLLEKQASLEAGDRIGLYSYGSGAVGEFFSGILQSNFKEHLFINEHTEMISSRTEVTVAEYEEIFADVLPVDGSTVELDVKKDPASICVAGITEHQLQYINKNN